MPPKKNTPKTTISTTTVVPGSSQIRLASLNTGVKGVRSKKPTKKSKLKSLSTTPATKQATLSGFGFAAKPKTPTAAQEEEEGGGGGGGGAGSDRKRRRIYGAGSQHDPITIDEDREDVVRGIKEIEETQFAGITQSPGWESDSDLETNWGLGENPQRSASVGEMTPRFLPAKKGGMAPRSAPARRKALPATKVMKLKTAGNPRNASTAREKVWVPPTRRKPLPTTEIVDISTQEEQNSESPTRGASPSEAMEVEREEDAQRGSVQQAKELDVKATSGMFGGVQQRQNGRALTRENSRDLMPPPPVTPKRLRPTLADEILSSQSPTPSPLTTQQTQTQSSQTRRIVGKGITAPLKKTPLMRPIEAAGLRVVKSSQWWENEDTQEDFSETGSESEAEAGNGSVVRDQVKLQQRLQIPGTQDDSDSPPLSLSHSVLGIAESSRSQGGGTQDSADPTVPTIPLYTPKSLRQRTQEVSMDIALDHVESTFPAFESHRRSGSASQLKLRGQGSVAEKVQNDSIASSHIEPVSQLHEAAQAIYLFATPRKSQSQQEDFYNNDMEMTFDLGTPCKRTSAPSQLPPAFSPRKPRTPSIRPQSPTLPRILVRGHSPSPYRTSSLGTTASTMREKDPSSLTSLNTNPQRPTQSQCPSAQETPLKMGMETPFNRPPSEAEDIVFDTPTKSAPSLNNYNYDDDTGNSQKREYGLTDGDEDSQRREYNDNYDDDATQSEDDPNIDFHPVKTQQFPYSMFVRAVTPPSLSSSPTASPSPPPSPTAAYVSQHICELVLEYGEERREKEEWEELPPTPPHRLGGDTTSQPAILTTSQLLPETLMESFPMPPPLTQHSDDNTQ